MPGFKYFKYFEKDNVVDGGTYDDSWVADENLIIKRIHIARKDGVAFTASTFYFKISGDVYTRAVVPCINLGPDIMTSPELYIPFPNGAKLEFTFKNLEGTTVSVMVTMETWSP